MVVVAKLPIMSQEFKIDTKTSTDQRKLVGAIIMASFGVMALWRWYETGLVFFLLFCLRDFIAAYFIAIRKASQASPSRFAVLLAYASSSMPLLYQKANSDVSPILVGIASMLMIVGFLIATMATIELGQKMGVSPAKRGERCLSGVYRYFRHPMYLGYVISETGAIILNPLNLFIFASSVLGYYLRARLENQLFESSSKETI